jgi:uncharacterized membrane protein YebE (DUF533 family)
MMSYGTLWSQIWVSMAGLAIMTAVAYYGSWSKQQDKRPAAPPPAPPTKIDG